MALVLVGAWAAGCARQPQAVLTDGRIEGCLDCHGEIAGFAAGHQPADIGCSGCHLGDPAVANADAAHEGMVRIPGNLSTAGQSCSTVACHPGIDLRVRSSLMNTMRGIVSVNRFAFGEHPLPEGHTPIQEILHSPADRHLRDLCASCHLGQEKVEAGPIDELSRGGGCNACHLHYSAAALASRQSTAPGEAPAVHPDLSIRVSNLHCFGCHSRSGRISTSYEGWHETSLRPDQAAGQPDLRLLMDERVFERKPSDLHHDAGLDCIDCHDGMEVMGDGRDHAHKEDAVSITCSDCHTESFAATTAYADLPPDQKRMLRLRGRTNTNMVFAVGAAGKRALINVEVGPDGAGTLISKNRGSEHPLKPPSPVCRRGTVHEALSCSTCHTAWAPQCITCHTVYRPDKPGFDLLDHQETPWQWEEIAGDKRAEPPVLGVQEAGAGSRRIHTFVPGMIMTLDASQFPDSAFTNLHRRLFAPAEAHTTTRQGRGCTDCHLSPPALGVGRGALSLVDAEGKSAWSFAPDYPMDPHDGLPLDAWSGFLQDTSELRATRTGARPFTASEQQRILRVGACLTCHQEDSEVMLQSLNGMPSLLDRLDPACRIP